MMKRNGRVTKFILQLVLRLNWVILQTTLHLGYLTIYNIIC